MKRVPESFAVWVLGLVLLLLVGLVQAARVSDVRATKHNLSAVVDGTVTPAHPTATPPVPASSVPARTVKASSETEICVFCHTPHAATLMDQGSAGPPVVAASAVKAPLWNRKVPSGSTYTGYTSSSLDAQYITNSLSSQPGGSSKLCLSCHDGSLAIGEVNVLRGTSPATITMSGTDGGKMPDGTVANTGFTRDLGVDLSNDHPISLTYDNTLASRDGELRALDGSQRFTSTDIIIGVRSSGVKPKLPLEPTGTSSAGQVQCATCHDPHIREADSSKLDFGRTKFLRLNRFQSGNASGTYSQANDIICLACHTKSGNDTSGYGTSNTSWAYSAHANYQVATQVYDATAATLREFPAGLQVYKAACLNCHDTHSVPGARRLLREGTTGSGSPKVGGVSAIEQTCYQCHDGTTTVITSVTTVPNIKTDFTTASNKIMPIAITTEAHDIGGNFATGGASNELLDCQSTTNKCGKDMIESRAKLGRLDTANRHAECTDCHNPHRVVKFKDFRGPSTSYGTISGAPEGSGTHNHRDTTNHTNIASGVLRGAWGVEPTYSSASFHALPSGYTVKRGDPGSSATAAVGDAYVTREYQICLKCHSDFGYPDDNIYPSGTRPNLGPPGTASGTNFLTQYTNQAKEFQAPATHASEPQGVSTSGAGAAYQGGTQYNHRSWHPVMAATGRSLSTRGIQSGNPWRAPWSNTSQVGSQTMYCTDCHGSTTTSGTTVRPNNNGTDAAPTEDGDPWGPHGSSSNFLLKGPWTATTGNAAATATDLCFRCHNPAIYRSTSQANGGKPADIKSGFSGPDADNYHGLHGNRVKVINCAWCHIAVPHGWKNKALLVNLNDVGEEAGHGAVGSGVSREVATSASGHVYNKGPYYMNAKLKVLTFAQSGKWTAGDCGSSGKSGTNLITSTGAGGTTADTGANTASNTGGGGKSWMTNTCSNPP